MFQQGGRGESKVKGIQQYGKNQFDITLVTIDQPLPPVVDDAPEDLPETIDADLVLDFLKHPDLSHDLAPFMPEAVHSHCGFRKANHGVGDPHATGLLRPCTPPGTRALQPMLRGTGIRCQDKGWKNRRGQGNCAGRPAVPPGRRPGAQRGTASKWIAG